MDVSVGISALLLTVLVLGLVVTGVVLLFVKLGAKAWWVVGPLAGVVLLLFVGSMVFWRGTEAEFHSKVNAFPADDVSSDWASVAPERPQIAMPAATVASADGADESFLADIYPSIVDAARGAARAVYRLTDNARLPRIKTIGNADSEVSAAVQSALNGSGGATQYNCAVTVNGTDSGTVQVVLDMPDNPISVTARFVSKPWAANFAQYVATSSKPVVRAGSTLAPTYEQAQSEALNDAVRQLEPYVRSALPRSADVAASAPNSRILRAAILAELRSGKLIIDRFPQQFDRPYGRLWREQLLVSASPDAMERVAFEVDTRQDMREAARARVKTTVRKTWINVFVSLGGIVVLIFAVYLVLNAATKGYYTTVLRVLAIGAIVVTIAALAVMVLA